MYGNSSIKIINKCEKEKDNFFCKICKFPLIDYMDFISNKEYDCCHQCFMLYVESRKKEWHSGWLPDNKTLKKDIYIRKKLALNKGV